MDDLGLDSVISGESPKGFQQEAAQSVLCFVEAQLAEVKKGHFIYLNKQNSFHPFNSFCPYHMSISDGLHLISLPTEQFWREIIALVTIICPVLLQELGALIQNIPKGPLSLSLPRKMKGSFGTMKNILCRAADPFLPGSPPDNGYLPDLYFHTSPPPTLSSKTGLKSLRSQAKPG